jgi:hypothetical protein
MIRSLLAVVPRPPARKALSDLEGKLVSQSSTPWTLRVYAAIPLAPALTGAAFALLLVTVLLGSEIALGRVMASPADLRLAIVHILIVAYRQVVDGVREWPFDASTVMRFALYLLIPLGSWSGGALVERVIDSLLE